MPLADRPDMIPSSYPRAAFASRSAPGEAPSPHGQLIIAPKISATRRGPLWLHLADYYYFARRPTRYHYFACQYFDVRAIYIFTGHGARRYHAAFAYRVYRHDDASRARQRLSADASFSECLGARRAAIREIIRASVCLIIDAHFSFIDAAKPAVESCRAR